MIKGEGNLRSLIFQEIDFMLIYFLSYREVVNLKYEKGDLDTIPADKLPLTKTFSLLQSKARKSKFYRIRASHSLKIQGKSESQFEQSLNAYSNQ